MRAYALVASGNITLASIAAAKAQKRKKSQGPKLPAIIAPITQKEIEHKTNWLLKFSGKRWAGPTKSMIRLCKDQVSNATMKDIICEAKEVSQASRRFAKEDEGDSDFDNDDSILNLRNGSDGSTNKDTTHSHCKNVDEEEENGNNNSDDDMMANGVDDEADCDIEEDGNHANIAGRTTRQSDIEEEDKDGEDNKEDDKDGKEDGEDGKEDGEDEEEEEKED